MKERKRKNIYLRHNFSSYKNVSDVKKKKGKIVRKKRIINNKGRGEGKSGKRMKFSPLSSQKKMS